MKRRIAVLISVAATASVAVGAAPAAADQKPTPNNNKCGAANMVNEHSAEAMMTAMDEHTADQGDAGMRAAVARTRC